MIIPHESLPVNGKKNVKSNGDFFQETYHSGSKNLRGPVKLIPIGVLPVFSFSLRS